MKGPLTLPQSEPPPPPGPAPSAKKHPHYTIPNNCVKAGQSVPKISGWWELTATSILCVFPRNLIDTGTKGNPPPPRAPSIPGPPQQEKDGQGIVGERRKVVLRCALVPPLAGGTFPPGRYHSAGGLEGPLKSATWEPVPGRGRERTEGGEGESERERLVRGSPTRGHATGWPASATSGGGTGPTQRFDGAAKR